MSAFAVMLSMMQLSKLLGFEGKIIMARKYGIRPEDAIAVAVGVAAFVALMLAALRGNGIA